MKQVKFLHCADIHLGAPFTSLGSNPELCAQRRVDLKLAFQRIIQVAKLEAVDLLLICGDLFEYDYIQKSGIRFLNDCFLQIPDIHVLIIPGNHDPFTSNSYYANFQWSENVHILSSANPGIVLEKMGVAVFGVGFDTKDLEEFKAGQIPELDPSMINILLLHGTLDMSDTLRAFNPVTCEMLDRLAFDYVALGHFHSRIQGAGKKGNIFNPGSPEPLGFDEPGEHGVFIGTLCKTDGMQSNLDVRFVRIGQRIYEKLMVALDGCETDEQAIHRIEQVLGGRNLSEMLLQITLRGMIDREYDVDVSRFQQHFSDRALFVRFVDETVPGYDLDVLSEDPGLKGLFVRKMLALAEKETDEHKRKLVLDALHYGLKALERGEVGICI